mmetsp:Transcript_93250/g.237228  ORF Transcript_93250/g.237228 Transcript_93250/m.237228 type:complete len:301 (+) Transcript_93250:386-1288(+)
MPPFLARASQKACRCSGVAWVASILPPSSPERDAPCGCGAAPSTCGAGKAQPPQGVGTLPPWPPPGPWPPPWPPPPGPRIVGWPRMAAATPSQPEPLMVTAVVVVVVVVYVTAWPAFAAAPASMTAAAASCCCGVIIHGTVPGGAAAPGTASSSVGTADAGAATGADPPPARVEGAPSLPSTSHTSNPNGSTSFPTNLEHWAPPRPRLVSRTMLFACAGPTPSHLSAPPCCRTMTLNSTRTPQGNATSAAHSPPSSHVSSAALSTFQEPSEGAEPQTRTSSPYPTSLRATSRTVVCISGR